MVHIFLSQVRKALLGTAGFSMVVRSLQVRDRPSEEREQPLSLPLN